MFDSLSPHPPKLKDTLAVNLSLYQFRQEDEQRPDKPGASASHPGILSSHESTLIYRKKIDMGIFRYTDKYTAPTKEQRGRYMSGKSEEHRFGPEGQIMLIEYHEAAYLKDDIDNIRILFTGFKDKQKAHEEAKRLADHHEHKAPHKNQFVTGQEIGNNTESADRKSG